MKFSDQERSELRRMLAAFKANLPPHELGFWYITCQSVKTIIENDEPPNVRRAMGLYDRNHSLIRGHAECVKCGRQFDIPDIGNFTAYGEDDVERVVASAKEWVERDAGRAGPCWGNVPSAPSENDMGVVLDSLGI